MNTLNFSNFGKPNNWALNSLSMNNPETMWHFVGADGNVGKQDNRAFEPFQDQGYLGGWILNMIAFDKLGTMWCTSKDGKIGKWINGGWEWDSKKSPAGTPIGMIAFDQSGAMWCVGRSGNLAKWDGNQWDDYFMPGGWTLWGIAFRPGKDQEVYCIGIEHNLGSYNIYQKAMTPITLENAGGLNHIQFNANGTVCYAALSDGTVGRAEVS